MCDLFLTSRIPTDSLVIYSSKLLPGEECLIDNSQFLKYKVLLCKDVD